MSQFRQNPVTKQWVLIAPNRAKRPEDYQSTNVMRGQLELDSACVFCPGNEPKNKEILKLPDSPDWQVRIIENKFQALEHTKVYRNRDFYNSRGGYGEHEVLITRKHNEPVAMQSLDTIELTLKTAVDRIKLLGQDPEISYVQFFHNHGRDAGASIIHPHYQIMATPIVSPHLHSELLGCYHYYQLNKSCIYCDIMKEELELGDRVVFESEHFVVMSAYASRKPFETWILPKKHGARFEDMTEDQFNHLASVLKGVLGKLYTKLGDPPLNFYTHSMPMIRDTHTMREEKSYHWHLTIFPRLSIWAGFEYATGIPVNPMTPEDTAAFLRN